MGNGAVAAREESATFGFDRVRVAPLVAGEAAVELVGRVGDRATAGSGEDLVRVGADAQAHALDADLTPVLARLGNTGDDLPADAVLALTFVTDWAQPCRFEARSRFEVLTAFDRAGAERFPPREPMILNVRRKALPQRAASGKIPKYPVD